MNNQHTASSVIIGVSDDPCPFSLGGSGGWCFGG